MTKIDEAIRAAQEAYSVYGKTGDLRATPPSAGNVKSMLSAALAVLLPAEPSEAMIAFIDRLIDDDNHMSPNEMYTALRRHLGLE